MSYPSVCYYPHALLPIRFIQHAHLAFVGDTGITHEKNLREKAGEYGLWALRNIVPKIWHFLHEPRIMNIFFTATAMLGVSYAFYPEQTKNTFRWIKDHIPMPTAAQVKFVAYIVILEIIAALALRTEGRFSNELLMKAWYAGKTVA